MQSNHALVTKVTFPRSKITGFGLVELMIGIALGLVLLLSLYSLLASNRQTYSSVQSTTSILADGQQISQLFNALLQQTGYRHYHDLKDQKKLSPDTRKLGNIDVTWKEGQAVFVSNDVSSNASVKDGTDVLQIRFTGSSNKNSIPESVMAKLDQTKIKPDDADGTIIDCTGTGVSSTAKPLIVAFYIDSNNVLTCADSLNHTVAIASDVESLQARVKKSATTQEYTDASKVTDWSDITNLEVAFLLAKPFDGAIKSTSNKITILDKELTIADGANKLRQVFGNNVTIRN